MKGRTMWGVLAALVVSGVPSGAAAQDLADFDYENLSFRGLGVDWGYIFPSRVEPTQTFTVKADFGYLGPGLRLMPWVSYWTSPFERSEVAELEDRVASLVERQTGEAPPTVNLGTIEWTDIALGMDAHVVWDLPGNFLSFAGLGAGVHILNGDGASINGTFVEDLLDSVTAGLNLHAGLEYPLTDSFRLTGQARYEVLGDLQYGHLRFGGQFMFGDLAPGEARGG